MEAFILKYITKQRSSHYCTRRFQLPQIHVIHSSLDQATFTFLHIILRHMCGIFTRKGFVIIYFLFSFKLIFLPWSMNHKNWLMKQKKSVNSNEPKRRDKLIIARDQNQTPKLQALFKRLFETLKLSSGNIPLSWLILIVHSLHWRRRRPVDFIRSHQLLKICYLAVEQPKGYRRKTDQHPCSSHAQKGRDWQRPSLETTAESVIYLSAVLPLCSISSGF